LQGFCLSPLFLIVAARQSSVFLDCRVHWQALILLDEEESDAVPCRSDRQTNIRPPGDNPPGKRAAPGRDGLTSRPGAFFILIVAQFSP
jgi:hypothetical protein